MANDFTSSRWAKVADENLLGKLDDTGLKLVYEACRNNITAENALVSFRLTWALTLSGGFLTAQAFLLSAVISDKTNLIGPAAVWLCLLIVFLSTIAAWFCWRTRLGVGAALNHIAFLRGWLDAIALPCGALGLPSPHGHPITFATGHRTAEMITLVLFTMWVMFAVSAGEWLAYLIWNNGVSGFQVVAGLCTIFFVVIAVILFHFLTAPYDRAAGRP